MLYRIGIGLVAFVALVTVGCGNFGVNAIRGSGKVVTETREVSNFHSVVLAGVGELNITQGDSEGLTIQAEDNLMPYITTQVENGILTINLKSGITSGSILPTQPIKYALQAKTLDSVQLSGAGNINAPALKSNALKIGTSGAGKVNVAQIAAKTLDASLTGAGDMTLSGQVDAQTGTLSGFGNYSAGALQTATTALKLSGAGNATVWASQTLDVVISGAGIVSYYGSPQVTQKVSGVGSVKSLGNK